MDTSVSSQRRKLLILLAWCLLLTLAWALWLYQLDASDLTFDEAATYYVAYRPPLDILEYLRGAVREHPPVYYLLIRGWMALAGTSEFSLRFFSVGVGLVVLALAGWMARLTAPPFLPRSHTPTPPVTGIVTATFLAVTPGMAYYARDARMYSLGVLWTILSVGLFLRDWLPVKEWPRRTAIVSLAAVHLMALFTHYYLLLPILVQPLVLLITGLIARRWRPFLTWCAVHCLPAILGLIWLWLSPGLQMTTGSLLPHVSIALPTRFQLFHLVGKILFSPVIQIRFHPLYWLLALAGVGILLAIWSRRAIGVWLTLALTVPLILSHGLPQPPAPRYMVFLIPLLALALGYLCVISLHLVMRLVKYRWLAWGATVGLTLIVMRMLSINGLYQAITFDRSHYSRTLETVKAHARPGDGVLFYGPWQWIPFHYYDPGDLPPITTLPRRAPPYLEPAEAEPVLERLLAQNDRLWVIPAAVDDVDPAHFVRRWLRTHAHIVWEHSDFSLYLPPLPPDVPTHHPELTFGQTLYLEQVAYEPQPVPAGEPCRLALYWSPLHRLETEDVDMRLALTLVDQAGRVWSAAHSSLGVETSPSSTWQPTQVITSYEGLMIPQGAPPGEYVVRLMVNDETTGEPLLVEIDREEEKEIDLLTIQVIEPTHAPVLYNLPQPNVTTFCAPDESATACLTLIGHEPGGLRFQQGYAVPFTLHWLSPSQALPELQLRLRVMQRPWLPLPVTQHISVLTRTLSLAPTYPAPLWTPDRLVSLPTRLTLPPGAPTGPAQVTLEVLEPDGTLWPIFEGPSTVALFPITIEGRPVLRRLPAKLTPIQIDFDEVGLRGYRVEGNPSPGGQLHLTYAWYAKTRPTAIYAVFNHLTTADGALAAQADGWPQEGRMLTTQWQAGEYIEDSYTLEIPPDAPPGPYTLYVGIYDAATNERRPAFQDSQRLPEDRVPIPLGEALPGEDGR